MISLPGPDQPDRRSRHKIKEIVVGLQDLQPHNHKQNGQK